MNRPADWLLAVTLASAAAAPPAFAQVEIIRTPLERRHVPTQIGSQYRDRANRAAEASLQGRIPEARELLRPVLAYCDALVRPGHEIVSVANATEYEAYVDTLGKGVPVDWIDTACPSAYKTHAFLDIEDKDVESALSLLGKASRLAPYWAEPPAERGYLLNQLGRPQEALQSYLYALDLTERFESNHHARALVLRGIGYTHIELGDLEAAERAYQQSLEIDPSNALAQRELEYIRKQRENLSP